MEHPCWAGLAASLLKSNADKTASAEKPASSGEQRSSGSGWLPRGTSEKQEEQPSSVEVETIIIGNQQQQDQQLHRIQQQPGKPAANAGQGTLALSSAVGTGSSAGKPAQQPQLAIKRDVFNPLLDACTWDHATGAWLTPATGPDARLCGMDWQNMLKLPPGWTPTSFVPTFFHDEPDPNQRDKPRLDIVVSFGNGHSVRYHPSAHPIWSAWPQPTDAMQKRYNRAKKIAKTQANGRRLHSSAVLHNLRRGPSFRRSKGMQMHSSGRGQMGGVGE